MGTINNNTGYGSGGYSDFTSSTIDVTIGSAYSISVSKAWPGTQYNDAIRVWIDYNKDGDFDDVGEQVLSINASKTTPIIGNITIPAAATLGSTRMRVSMKYNAIPTACESFSYGQVEDYTITITATGRIDEDYTNVNDDLTLSLYPNPVKGDVLYLSTETEFNNYKIFNLMGQLLSQGNIENKSVYVANLATGTYLLEVASDENVVVKKFIKQ